MHKIHLPLLCHFFNSQVKKAKETPTMMIHPVLLPSIKGKCKYPTSYEASHLL
jgi:folate-dependent phosphoribosylglycinamide formyltransferase PurN